MFNTTRTPGEEFGKAHARFSCWDELISFLNSFQKMTEHEPPPHFHKYTLPHSTTGGCSFTIQAPTEVVYLNEPAISDL